MEHLRMIGRAVTKLEAPLFAPEDGLKAQVTLRVLAGKKAGWFDHLMYWLRKI